MNENSLYIQLTCINVGGGGVCAGGEPGRILNLRFSTYVTDLAWKQLFRKEQAKRIHRNNNNV